MSLITPSPQIRLKKKQEEKEQKRMERSEACLYTIIKVARDEDLGDQIGKEIYLDLVDHDKVRTFRTEKQMPFIQFKEEVAKAFGIPVQFQRYWLWEERKNHTYRPYRTLTAQEEIQSVGQLREVSNKENNAELKLFLEVELCLDLRPFPPQEKTKEDVLLFFKLYDPLIEKIRYVGRLFVKQSGKPLEILTKLNELAGFLPDEEIDLFEEIKFEPNVMCERVDSNMSFRDCVIGDGDIICFQKSLRNQCSEQYRFPEVPSYLEYVHNRLLRLKKEHEEKEQKRKEKEEACLYTIVKVARDEDLGEQIGKEIYFDLVDHDKVRTFRILKQMPFTQFKEEVAKTFGTPVKFQRYWLWEKRENSTYRPNRALTAQEEIQSVGELREVSNEGNNVELKLFLEVELCLDLRPLSTPGKTKDEILLFFKLYDPLEEKIRYVGRIFVKRSSKPLEILTKLNELVGFSSDEEIEFFEEINFQPDVICEHIDSNMSFRDCEIGDGAIICFQKSVRNRCSEQYRFPEVPSFLEHVHYRQRLKKEQEEEEQKRKEKEEACLYRVIKVARDEDFGEQIGKEIYFDLVDHDKVRTFRIQKQMPFIQFKEEVAKAFGIPMQFQRYWLWAKRQNRTYRPDRALTAQEEIQPVGELREISDKQYDAELKLYLEVELCLDLRPSAPPGKAKEEILLFFKLYDPLKENIRYVGRLSVKVSSKPLEILLKLKDLAGFSPDEEIELFEEIKFETSVMCEKIDSMLSFLECQLQNGDIICYQKSLRNQCCEQYRFPEVPSFLEYMHNRQVVHFRSLEKPKEDEFSLELSKQNNYDEVVERLAHHLRLDDPSKVRLTPHNCYSQRPKPQPIRYRGVDSLTEMLSHYNQTSDILYYEILDIPLPELQGLKTLKVVFRHAAKHDEVTIHTIRLPKQSTVEDVFNDLKPKVELSRPDADLRLLEVFYHKIYKIFPLNERIENINDQYWMLRAEEIPEEEKNLGPHSRLIHVYHFMKGTAQNQVKIQNFGEPLILVIHEGETLTKVKARIQKKLQVPQEEFSKWKFAVLSMGHFEYLEESDIVSNRFQKRDVYHAWEQYLGLEHTYNAPKRSHAANQVIDIYARRTTARA